MLTTHGVQRLRHSTSELTFIRLVLFPEFILLNILLLLLSSLRNTWCQVTQGASSPCVNTQALALLYKLQTKIKRRVDGSCLIVVSSANWLLAYGQTWPEFKVI
jgi:hypothetical protein